MQRVSAAYRAEQNDYLRQENYIWVYLGIINKEAQAFGKANGTFTRYSRQDKVTQSEEFEAYYATPEENMARVDSTQFFMPRGNAFALYQGAVTQEILAPITFTFEPYTSLDIKGLTIDFGNYYPTRFTVTNGSPRYTYVYNNDSAGEFVCEDIFRDTSYITITPLEMVGGRQRLRIIKILFGVGLLFDNTTLINTSFRSSCAHVSDILPSKTLSFTISNLNKRFAADDPHSFVSFLQEQQEIEFDFGRKLPDGTIYKIPGSKMYLNSWSSNDLEAQFNAVGFMDYMDGTFYNGQYYENGISLYDLAEEICIDAGLESYAIDNYLKSLITHNPVPIEKHKNLLQLIANASRSILRENRSGGLEIVSSFKPDISSVTSNGQTIYSNVANTVNEEISASEYGTAEKDFTYADGSQYFVPRTQRNYVETSYISSHVSKSDGTFITNPTITVQWESAWTFFNVTILFNDTKPKTFKIHLYEYGTFRETVTIDDVDLSTIVKHDFWNIDKIVIEFTKAKPYQRVHVARIRFGNITDYSISYTDMSSTPLATTTEFIKNVSVVYSEFAYGTDVKKASTAATVIGENFVTFTKAYHDYSLAYAEITDDEQTYKKKSKVYCDALPAPSAAKSSTIYILTKTNTYALYEVTGSNDVKSWTSLGTYTEQIVNSLPATLQANKLYLVRTTTNDIYHIYTLYTSSGTTSTVSLGYVVKGTLTIISSGAYFIKYTSTVGSKVDISAIEFVINEKTCTHEVGQIGMDKTATNVLIDNQAMAEDENEWLREYFGNDVEYDISYRGEPAIDPDDQIYTENKYVSKNLVRIVDTQIDTSTGMSMNCKLTARRTHYVEPALVDVAIVDESEVE